MKAVLILVFIQLTCVTALELSPDGLNVCCEEISPSDYYCCEGWTHDGNSSDCITPICSIPCGDHGTCTSPEVCTCQPGYAGKICDTESNTMYDARLLYGKEPHQGLVQVRSEAGIWSYIHPDAWSRNNSHVLCQQLGYQFAYILSDGNWTGNLENSFSVLDIGFACSGNEDALYDCDVVQVDADISDDRMVVIECYVQNTTDWCSANCDQETISRFGCKCDPLCISFGDCCPDFFNNEQCPSEINIGIEEKCSPMPFHHEPSFTLPDNFDVGYFFISDCSDSRVYDDISSLCEHQPDINDPFTFTPVQERNSTGPVKKVYRNIFCAICNMKSLHELQAWDIVVEDANEDTNFTIHNIIPPNGEVEPRTCLLNLESESTCYYHRRIQRSCANDYVPHYTQDTGYQNIFCAVCDDVYPQQRSYDRSVNLNLPVITQDIQCTRAVKNLVTEEAEHAAPIIVANVPAQAAPVQDVPLLSVGSQPDLDSSSLLSSIVAQIESSRLNASFAGDGGFHAVVPIYNFTFIQIGVPDVTAGDPPGEPDDPAGVPPGITDVPTGIRPVVPDEPAGVPPGITDIPTGIRPVVPDEPAGVPPGITDVPTGIRPVVPDEPAGVPPGAGNSFPVLAPSLITIFDFGSDKNVQNRCNEGEIYDYFSQKCRLLSCSIGFVVSNGTCKAEEHKPIVLPERIPPKEISQINKTIGCANVLNGYFQAIQKFENEKIQIRTNDITVNSDTIVVYANSSSFSQLALSLNEISRAEHYNNSNAGKLCNASSILLVHEQQDIFTTDESKNDSIITCIHRTRTLGCGSNISNDVLKPEKSTNIRSFEFTWKHESNCYGIKMSWDVCFHTDSSCAEIVLAPDEFEIVIGTNSLTVLLKAAEKELSSDEFRFGENGTLFVCGSVFYGPEYESNKLGAVLSYVTSGCFVFSLVATFITFISYCVFRELRNVSGYTVINLSIAFFVAQFVFLLSPHLLQPPELCLISAIIGHFSWLSGFFWMNALSFVTTSNLSRKTLVRDKTMEMCRLIRYMAYAWGSPLLIVIVCISIHFCDCTDIAPIYGLKGASLCWLIGHDGYAIIWGFAGPVFALLFINMILFIHAIVALRSKMASTRRSLKKMKEEIAIYVKLTSLMGLPWMLGFVLAFVPKVYFGNAYIILNYIYTILNSLQGFFIFWVLVLTGRAGKLWRRKCCGSRSLLGTRDQSSKPAAISSGKIATTSFTVSSVGSQKNPSMDVTNTK